MNVRSRHSQRSPWQPSLGLRSPTFVAALRYAEIGWPVYPTNPRNKRPLLPRPTDRSKGGAPQASCGLDLIEQWWSAYPDAMVSGAAGAESGFFVVELDSTHGQFNFCWMLNQLGLGWPSTLTTLSPRGGYHLFFSWDDAYPIRTTASRVGPGIDTIGVGGGTILPPSRRPNGGHYTWFYPQVDCRRQSWIDPRPFLHPCPPELLAYLPRWSSRRERMNGYKRRSASTRAQP